MTTGLQSENLGVVDSGADTVRIPVLPEAGFQQRAGGETTLRSYDPYNTDIGTRIVRPRSLWTSDDMRRLSEAIIHAK